MQYRIIINTGNVHTAKEIASNVENLQKAVKHHLEVGHTIVEVQTREQKTEGWVDWKTT